MIALMRQDEIMKVIKKMSVSDAKKKLFEIYALINKVGYGGYTKEKCFDDIQGIYEQDIIMNAIFDKKND